MVRNRDGQIAPDGLIRTSVNAINAVFNAFSMKRLVNGRIFYDDAETDQCAFDCFRKRNFPSAA